MHTASTASPAEQPTFFRYAKRKNRSLLQSMQSSALLHLEQPQNYLPLYRSFFKVNATNADGLQLNHSYHLHAVHAAHDKRRNVFHCSVESAAAAAQGHVARDVFFKYVPLIDPLKYLQGKYHHIDVARLHQLPQWNSVSAAEDDDLVGVTSAGGNHGKDGKEEEGNEGNGDDVRRCLPRFLSPHNQAYVDCFFSFLSSRMHSLHGFVHGVESFGMYLGVKRQFAINVINDVDYLIESKFFNKQHGKLFQLDNAEELMGAAQIKQPPIVWATNAAASEGETSSSSLLLLEVEELPFPVDGDNCNVDTSTHTITPAGIEVSSLDECACVNDDDALDECGEAEGEGEGEGGEDEYEDEDDDDDEDEDDETCTVMTSSSRSSYSSSTEDELAVTASSSVIGDGEDAEGEDGDGDGEDDGSWESIDDSGEDSEGDHEGEEDNEECEEDGEEEDDDDDSLSRSEWWLHVDRMPVAVVAMETCEGTLDQYILDHPDLSVDEWFSILMQIIMTLLVYQEVFAWTHNDLHTNNIMHVPTNETHLCYQFRGKLYRVPTFGRIWKIIDFGRSIYQFEGRVFCSDAFDQGGDALGQYNTEPFLVSDKQRIDPNPSFDLCRLGCCLFDLLVDDIADTFDLDQCDDPVQRLAVEWCLNDKGINIMFKRNGEERYPGFKLYKMIARQVHYHTPHAQLERAEFRDRFLVSAAAPSDVFMNIDAYPRYHEWKSGAM